jgi:hypothetical protein
MRKLAQAIAKTLDNGDEPPDTPDLALDRLWDLLIDFWGPPTARG